MSAQPVEGRRRKERSDAGKPRQTARDTALLQWIAEQSTVPIDLMAAALLGRSVQATYAMVRRWKEQKWVETGQILPGPAWVWLKRATARRYLGWDLGDWTPTAGMAAHYRAVAAVRLHLGRGPGVGGWISERHLRHDPQGNGFRKSGDTFPHMPDGVYVDDHGREWAVEVELTPKGRERTEAAISDGYDAAVRDGGRSGVIYFAPESVRTHVQKAVEAVAERRSRHGGRELAEEIRAAVQVRPIEEVPLWR